MGMPALRDALSFQYLTHRSNNLRVRPTAVNGKIGQAPRQNCHDSKSSIENHVASLAFRETF
jgi:hypothetical protein